MMKKKLVVGAVAACLTLGLSAANAAAIGEHSLSIGYAQSHVDFAQNGDVSDNPNGMNLKYRYEFDQHFGVISSFTYTSQSWDVNTYFGRKVGNLDLDYYSLMVGPSFRFNDYVSVYGLVGAAHGKTKANIPSFGVSITEKDTDIGYGFGMQFNPIEDLVIDASYEYTEIDYWDIGTWTVGVGYNF